MDARCVVDGAVWYRRRHCILLSACASDRGCPDYGVGGSGGRFGRYGITATAVVLQPVTGIGLALIAGYPLSSPWLLLSILLYGLIGCCWLPVVWLQIRMRDLAVDATYNGQPLPVLYEMYYRRWFMLGWPAFIGVLIIFYLMVAKPAL